jgi:hypothetical protein
MVSVTAAEAKVIRLIDSIQNHKSLICVMEIFGSTQSKKSRRGRASPSPSHRIGTNNSSGPYFLFFVFRSIYGFILRRFFVFCSRVRTVESPAFTVLFFLGRREKKVPTQNFKIA